MQNSEYRIVSNENYDRWERMLKIIAKKQTTVSRDMDINERLSMSTHKRAMDLLAAVKKRVAEQEE